MIETLAHLQELIKSNEELAEDMRNELLRFESHIWGLRCAEAIIKSTLIMENSSE